MDSVVFFFVAITSQTLHSLQFPLLLTIQHYHANDMRPIECRHVLVIGEEFNKVIHKLHAICHERHVIANCGSDEVGFHGFTRNSPAQTAQCHMQSTKLQARSIRRLGLARKYHAEYRTDVAHAPPDADAKQTNRCYVASSLIARQMLDADTLHVANAAIDANTKNANDFRNLVFAVLYCPK